MLQAQKRIIETGILAGALSSMHFGCRVRGWLVALHQRASPARESGPKNNDQFPYWIMARLSDGEEN